ncbi:MAG: hypothetical protein C4529_08885 [Deltaproteobacteria bacterium]|nr:MAG: hypothetical protein C4529_08885 [Deltaproteobacteria bacterium]
MSLERKSLVLAKIEAAYGVDPVPVAATDAILTGAVSYEIVGKSLERDVVLPHFGKLSPANVGEAIKLSIPVEMRGAGGAVDAIPRIGRLLRACNMPETVNAGVSVVYSLTSTEDGESVTLYWYADGILHKALGCVGTVKLSVKSGEYGKLQLEFTGIYAGGHASDQATPAATFGDAAIPSRFLSALFSINGYAGAIENFEVDLGNEIGKRVDANSASGIRRYFINDRSVKGSCDPRVVPLATYNPWSAWDASTAGAITAQFGSAVGNKVVVALPNCTLTDAPKYGGREKERIYQLAFGAYPTLSAGNNELTITFS